MATETESPLYLASGETETENPTYLASVAEDRKVLHMVLGDYEDEVVIEDSDVVFGRMPVGGSGDESEFDFVPPTQAAFTAADSAVLAGGDDVPEMFQAPPDESQDAFPVLRAALKHFTAAERPPRVVRVDTDDSYNDFVSDKAVKEITRRLDALEAKVNSHVDDPFAHSRKREAQQQDVLGAAQAITDLQSARTASDAVDAMPQVPLDLPDFAVGKVKCWRDGDFIVVSVRFATADGTPRFATAASRPAVDADDVAQWAMKSGADAATILGALPELTAVACGKRLVRDVAGAALKAHAHSDVCGASQPVLLASKGTTGVGPLAAIMWVQQLADSGHSQAQLEMAKLHRAAMTPMGQQIAAPLLSEAKRRLAAGRAEVLGAQPKTLWQKIAGWLR